MQLISDSIFEVNAQSTIESLHLEAGVANSLASEQEMNVDQTNTKLPQQPERLTLGRHGPYCSFQVLSPSPYILGPSSYIYCTHTHTYRMEKIAEINIFKGCRSEKKKTTSKKNIWGFGFVVFG